MSAGEKGLKPAQAERAGLKMPEVFLQAQIALFYPRTVSEVQELMTF